MKTILFIIIVFLSLFGNAQIINTNIQRLENDLKRLEKESQEIKKRNIIIQDSITIIENLIKTEKRNTLATKEFVCETQNNIQSVLREEPTVNANKICIIPKENKLKLLEYVGESYWKVSYNDLIGYVNEVSLLQTPEMKDAIMVFNDKKKTLDANRQKDNEERILKRLEEEFGKENAYRISIHSIWIGMSTGMARASIGEPIKINISTGSWGKHEQWIYNKRYLYFENGLLTSWQNEE